MVDRRSVGISTPFYIRSPDQNSRFTRRQPHSWADAPARNESIAGLTRSHLIADYWLERTEGWALCMPQVEVK